ncbi:YcgN family cysteine cluster protein [Brucella sp. 6810]|uniref:YcgN family cysteine cluster protein n=1 Tax=unclassified Brucella TaxID=2632610 RepID=UPI001297FE79|nr:MULTISPECIES: YcgN family cysteine cluster protein [unclassified Brucella]MRN43854.1 YcgN family cysteine cluster protein [Brucella sp. 09RB8913]MRN60260.1 YcgN family cysteine cluster protein [Brucella sp. 09RB8918]QGA56371.1 YcgN family cysteine cluster protein [Brucella sp. 2280]QNQ62968.1 YcgN family cysteine cluster protein [Brucella sp. 6810]
MTDKPFWQTKNLNQLTRSEWESLCDGCGQCCLHKLQDEDTDEIYWTSVACTLLNPETCQCRDYPNRKKTVPDCVFLTPEIVDEVDWLPVTCAYRLVAEGSDLYWWHPLVSGSSETVHEAGISVRGKVTAFDHDMQDDDDYLDHMVTPDKIAR